MFKNYLAFPGGRCGIPSPVRDLHESLVLRFIIFASIFFVGGGVVMAGGVDAVVALAEKLEAPVCTTYLHNDAFPKSNKLWMGNHSHYNFPT